MQLMSQSSHKQQQCQLIKAVTGNQCYILVHLLEQYTSTCIT